ncbi:hypothetical protein BS78_03G291200 [Paspalum vaginatum]|nr:hypothetical protein BS78_03G291200 [Paspalum vaginatum]KAJ1285601.1 hypothetical protein BS78_03G291200 [Paspalum vaginatum]
MRPSVCKVMQVSATNSDTLSMPLLQVRDDTDSSRYQSWLVATVLHSLTLFIYTFKASEGSWDIKCAFHSIILIVNFVLLIMLVRCFPITKIAGAIVGSVLISYLAIVLVDMRYLKENTIILEIMLIPLTVCMHTLRFVSQGAVTEFEVVPFIVAFLGVLPGITQILIPMRAWFCTSEILHIPFQISTFLGAVFRLLDVIYILCDPIKGIINYFRSRLQESFI